MHPYCPRCGTTLSSHEGAQGYKDITDTLYMFTGPRSREHHFVAWTTNPMTLPSNVACASIPTRNMFWSSLGQEGRTARYYLG